MNDFNLNKNNYIKGINKFFDYKIKITQAELLFIFDKDTQQNMFRTRTNNNFGTEYCIKKILNFIYFL